MGIARTLVLCSALVASVSLTACSATDSVAPVEQTASKSSVNTGPTHELRILVNADGDVVGVDAARIKSERKNFVPAAAGELGKRLFKAPDKQGKLVSDLQQKAAGLPVAFYEVPRGWKRKARAAKDSGVLVLGNMRVSMRDSVVQEDGMDPAAFEAFVDQQVSSVVEAGADYFELYPDEEGYSEELREASLMAAGTGGSLLAAGSLSSTSFTLVPDCGTLRIARGLAAVGVAVAIGTGVTSVMAAAAPVATVMGGITIMVLPSTSVVAWAAGWALGGIGVAGGSLALSWSALRQCLRGHGPV